MLNTSRYSYSESGFLSEEFSVYLCFTKAIRPVIAPPVDITVYVDGCEPIFPSFMVSASSTLASTYETMYLS